MSIEMRAINCLEENGLKIEDGKIQGNMDSFTLIASMVALEEEFDIEISQEYIGPELFNTVQHLCEVIKSLMK